MEKESGNKKLISWNVNGIRAVARKGVYDVLENMDADIICFQETKADNDQVREALSSMFGYQLYSNSALRKGYSGTAILTREEPLSHHYGIGMDEHDTEGRVITLEYGDFYLVNVYTPNSGAELARLDYRTQWDRDFLKYLRQLNEKKPVLVCGDLNVANKDIDLANPKPNYNKSAGYMQAEIDGINNLLSGGFIDSYRQFYPDKEKAYTWWSFRGNARANNVGWRIDYFLVSNDYKHRLKDAFILPEISLSDHCPVGIII